MAQQKTKSFQPLQKNVYYHDLNAEEFAIYNDDELKELLKFYDITIKRSTWTHTHVYYEIMEMKKKGFEKRDHKIITVI